MKKIPEIRHSWARLYSLLRMDPAGDVLVTAVKQKIFDHLREPEPADRIARLLKLPIPAIPVFFSMHWPVWGSFTKKKTGQFSNTPESDAFLVRLQSPSYLGPFFCRVRNFFTRCRSPEHIESLLMNGPANSMATRDDSEWVAYTRQASATSFAALHRERQNFWLPCLNFRA